MPARPGFTSRENSQRRSWRRRTPKAASEGEPRLPCLGRGHRLGAQASVNFSAARVSGPCEGTDTCGVCVQLEEEPHGPAKRRGGIGIEIQ